jgi:hypothetical protein
LALLSETLLELKEWDEAEPLLREALAIRETSQPDAWTTFNTRSMLGGALLGQKKFTEAEPLLVSGYEGLKQREATIPEQGKPRLSQALVRLIELYTEWHAAEPDQGYQIKAAQWQKKLEEQNAAEKSESNGV